MPQKKAELDSKMRQAAALLGAGEERKDVAKKIGRDESQLSRWMQRDDFRALVRSECNKTIAEIRPQAIRHLVGLLRTEKPGWLTKSTCDTLVMLADRLEQASAGNMTVSFPGMPEPKMPDGDEKDQEKE